MDEGKLVANPSAADRARYRLGDLVAQCDPEAPLTEEDEAWLGDRPAGGELV